MSAKYTVELDRTADALYVRLREIEVARTVALDDLRNVDYDENDGLVGIEFLGVKEGIDLEGVPNARSIAKAIDGTGLGIQILSTTA